MPYSYNADDITAIRQADGSYASSVVKGYRSQSMTMFHLVQLQRQALEPKTWSLRWAAPLERR